MKTSMSDDELKKVQEEWDKAKEESQQITYEVILEFLDILDNMRKQYLKLTRDVKLFSAEYWTREEDIKALGFIISCVEEYTNTGKCDRVHNGLCDLYVIDKASGNIHRVGEHDHDSFCTNLGYVDYYNMQCGDGGGVDSESGFGFSILQSEHGSLVDEFGIIDRVYYKEILQYLKEQGEDISEFDDEGHYIRTEEE